MYTQSMDTLSAEDKALEAASKAKLRSADELQSQERFDARIDAGDFIEAKDWMPEHYRKTLVRQISR